MDNQDKMAEQAAEIARLHLVLADRQAMIAKLMGEAARAGMAGATVQGAGEVPQDVRYAVDRMCLPLDASRLSGVTAAEDARCMAVIKEYIERSAAPAVPSEQVEPMVRAALERIARWHGEFPEVTCSDGTVTSYGVAYGSNGQRDYMRQVARDALAAAPAAPLPEQTGPSAEADLSKRLRDYANASWKFSNVLIDKKDLLAVLDEIERLNTAKSHLILQAQMWHCEAKSQRATVIGILARLGLPENDWEAKRLIVAHIAKLIGAPVPRVDGIASKESVETAAPGAPSLKDSLAEALHYPGCWDTAAYPALSDALSAVYDHFKCSECAAPGASIGDDRKFCRLARAWDVTEHGDGAGPVAAWEALVAYIDNFMDKRGAA